MSSALAMAEQRAVCDKLRCITEQPWVRHGSQLLMATPLANRDALGDAISSLQEFDLEPDKVSMVRGTQLRLNYQDACSKLKEVSIKALHSWAKGVD